MPKILIVDDDKAMLDSLPMHLAGSYEVIATGDPEQALGLALERKPDAILLDLLMPKLSGFEVCQALKSLSYTCRIPIFLMSGEIGATYEEFCGKLGAKGFFRKPLDLSALKAALDGAVREEQPEQRANVRLRLRILLDLKGVDADGQAFEARVSTANVSAAGFLCQCSQPLQPGEVVAVFLEGEQERYAGLAEVVRRESPGLPWPWYGFRFKQVTNEWILKAN